MAFAGNWVLLFYASTEAYFVIDAMELWYSLSR